MKIVAALLVAICLVGAVNAQSYDDYYSETAPPPTWYEYDNSEECSPYDEYCLEQEQVFYLLESAVCPVYETCLANSGEIVASACLNETIVDLCPYDMIAFMDGEDVGLDIYSGENLDDCWLTFAVTYAETYADNYDYDAESFLFVLLQDLCFADYAGDDYWVYEWDYEWNYDYTGDYTVSDYNFDYNSEYSWYDYWVSDYSLDYSWYWDYEWATEWNEDEDEEPQYVTFDDLDNLSKEDEEKIMDETLTVTIHLSGVTTVEGFLTLADDLYTVGADTLGFGNLVNAPSIDVHANAYSFEMYTEDDLLTADLSTLGVAMEAAFYNLGYDPDMVVTSEQVEYNVINNQTLMVDIRDPQQHGVNMTHLHNEVTQDFLWLNLINFGDFEELPTFMNAAKGRVALSAVIHMEQDVQSITDNLGSFSDDVAANFEAGLNDALSDLYIHDVSVEFEFMGLKYSSPASKSVFSLALIAISMFLFI